MRPCHLAALLALTIPPAAQAQWQLQDAHTTADLRGIDSVGNGVAWASGTNGTVLRTEDAGFVWQLCATPPNAEHLDFRGIQAFDNNTAIVMSSGKGDLSRLYKTTDGCQTWKLLFTNPDKDGFFDVVKGFHSEHHGNDVLVLGDPVEGHIAAFRSSHNTATFSRVDQDPGLKAASGEGLFAASNSSLAENADSGIAIFGTGGPEAARVFVTASGKNTWAPQSLSFFAHGKAGGIFSVANHEHVWVIAGGEYTQPDLAKGTAAVSANDGHTWLPATTPPHGYRSAVAYDPTHNTWITVGPNGTDISTDDGRNWHSLKPSPAAGDPPDADQHWNALSLPFVVGPHGRIATLRPDALTPKP